jgi:gamma-glutamyltranspeptidase
MTLDDLKNYNARIEEPLFGSYRDKKVATGKVI